ncbi:MAG TPA: hypothetical protein VE693_04510, partial [Gaiellaceae bacterium]|nr:hypothetical protein [Gaiellaceae bacterium]
ETSDASHCVYSIVDGEPLSAAIRFHATSGLGRGDWSTRSEVHSSMTCDAENFRVEAEFVVTENGERVFERAWDLDFPRDNV